MLQTSSTLINTQSAKMNFKAINSYWCAALIVAILGLAFSLVEAKNQKDGKFAQKLDEYSSTLKCMLNIAEETLPGNF